MDLNYFNFYCKYEAAVNSQSAELCLTCVKLCDFTLSNLVDFSLDKVIPQVLSLL